VNVLDLFSGLGGWSQAFVERGHNVLTLDSEPWFGADIQMDVRDWDMDLPWRPDFILAGPPCTAFSLMKARLNWKWDDKRYVPASFKAREAVSVVEAGIEVIEKLKPRWWVLENPVGMLKSSGLLGDPQTLWQCHVGRAEAKPTHLWGRWPKALKLPPLCHIRRKGHLENCCCHDHTSSPRGSKTGTQNISDRGDWILRAKLPYEMSELFCVAAERSL
jgi:site-specific DNA-cytosine methylase